MNKKNEYQDEGLKGNERIEDAIFALQKEATQEQLAHTLTVIRRRMKEGGQLIVAVEPDADLVYFFIKQTKNKATTTTPVPMIIHLFAVVTSF